MTEMTIRMATPRDADAIFEIENLCFPDPWSLQSIEYELEENPAAVYVVAEIEGDEATGSDDETLRPDDPHARGSENEAAGQIIGYAGLWWIENEGHITNVAVRPGFRNRRIGSHILEALLEATQEEGIDIFTLEVRRSNDAARALYEKYGFSVEGIRKGYYRTGPHGREDALILWRRSEEDQSEI